MGIDCLANDQGLSETVRRQRDAYALFAEPAATMAPIVLVVASDSASADAHSSELGYQALLGTGIAADVLVCSQGP
jgi:hypothetical protein